MDERNTRECVLADLARNDGLLPMRPCWVTRDFLPPGKRLGLTDTEYVAGERGYVCERWLVSETKASNAIDTPYEGQSYLKTSSAVPILLVDALKVCPDELLGAVYAKQHSGLDRLLKIYDFKAPLFYHMHQMKADADRVGMNSKEEAHYYLDADPGSRPDIFLGVQPAIVREHRQEEVFTRYLERWEGDSILEHAVAFNSVAGEGFHLPAGILHAPGTSLNLELQESSEVMAVLQAEIDGVKISKKLLCQHIPADALQTKKERAVLDQIDWKACSDPHIYENHRLYPRPVRGCLPKGVSEEWVWYNTTKFSGTRVTLQPGAVYVSKGLGVHGLFIWRGRGLVDEFLVEGQKVSLADSRDEFLVAHDKALKGVTLTNIGAEPLVLFKFFGPEINDAVIPWIERRA